MLNPKINRFKAIRFHFTCLVFISSITFQSTVHAEPNALSIEEYRAKGYAEQQQGNLVTALNIYTQALMLKPNDPALLNDIGITYEKFGFQSKAEEYYLSSVHASEAYLPAYMNLGYIYLKEGYASQAFNYFKKRYELGDKKDPWTLKAKEEMLRINPDYDRMITAKEIEQLNEALAAEGRNVFYNKLKLSARHFTKGKEWLAKKQLHKAIEELDAALVYTPRNPKIIKFRAQVLSQMKSGQKIRRGISSQPYKKGPDVFSANNEDSKKLTATSNEHFISE